MSEMELSKLKCRKRQTIDREKSETKVSPDKFFAIMSNFIERKSKKVFLMDHPDQVDIYLIKEGVAPDSGGIGIWFNSLSRTSSLRGIDCIIYSCEGVTRLCTIDGIPATQRLQVGAKQELAVKIFRNHLLRKLFAKFGFDAEEVLNFLFIYFFVQFVRKFSKQNMGLGKIITPIYEGFSAYLPATWPVWVGLVSSTKHSIQDLSIADSRYRHHYAPKIRKEEFLLRKFKDRIAISEFIIDEYKGIREDEYFEILSPKIYDPKSSSTKVNDCQPSNLPERKRQILFLGRMEPRKGFDILLEAWKLSNLFEEGYELYMCGEVGEDLPTGFQNLEGVRFTGKISEREKEEYLCLSSLVVVPSRFESFGIVTLEAMANSTPVLVSDVAGLRSVSSIANSVQVFEAGNALDCGLKMSKILSSETEWAVLSARVRADFEKFFLLN